MSNPSSPQTIWRHRTCTVDGTEYLAPPNGGVALQPTESGDLVLLEQYDLGTATQRQSIRRGWAAGHWRGFELAPAEVLKPIAIARVIAPPRGIRPEDAG